MVNELLRLQEAEGLVEERDPFPKRVKRVEDVVEVCRPSRGECDVRKRLFSRLREVLGSLFTGCEVHAYGSSGTAFAGKGLDMDVVVLTKDYLQNALTAIPPTSARRDGTSDPAAEEEGDGDAGGDGGDGGDGDGGGNDGDGGWR